MKQLEELLAERSRAQAEYERTVKQMEATERELKDVRSRRAQAKKEGDFDSYLSQAEDEKQLHQKFEMLVYDEKRTGMIFAEADKRHDDLRLQTLGMHQTLRSYDQVKFRAIELRIRELEEKIQQQRQILEAEHRNRQRLADKLAALTDLTEAELQQNPQHLAIGKYNRRTVVLTTKVR